MRIALVGGAGFLGCAIADRLQRDGHAVALLDLPSRLAATAQLAPGAARVAFDFATEDAASALAGGFDALAHLGSTTHPAHSMASMVYDATSNIAPSVRLFEAAVAAGVGTIVFSSSGGTVYGAPVRLPVVEDAAAGPLCAYGVSKLAIEHYLRLVPGTRAISLRVANPYGVFQLRGAPIGVIARYARQLAAGVPIEVWGDGSIVRDYIAIEDVADAFATALAAPGIASGTYNIGSGTGTSIDGIIALLFGIAGRQTRVDYLPARSFDVPAIVLDATRWRDQSGWHPRIPLEQGVGALWRAALDAG
jgi:UDP-glucose 4-epimerase